MPDEIKSGFKECPACAEPIRERAKVCRFCGAILTDEPLPEFIGGKPGAVNLEELEGLLNGGDIGRSLESQFAELGVQLSSQQQHRLEEFLAHSDDEYRTATVMFVDITGYTALSEKLKPEVIKREILNPFYEICSRTIDFFNGMVVKFQGDACMAVFGAPKAYDRDAESAVRAVLEIRERVRRFPSVAGIKVTLSSGVETGEILSSAIQTGNSFKFDVFGPAVNMAQRIESISAADTIRIGEETHGLVKQAFDLQEMAAQKVKNVARALKSYSVLSAKTPNEIRHAETTAFIGRAAELQKIENHWDDFLVQLDDEECDSEFAYGVKISGEAGIGKSRLAYEFAASNEKQCRMLTSECLPYGRKIAWGLWRGMIASLWNGSIFDPIEDSRKQLANIFNELGYSNEEQLPFLAMFGIREGLAAFSAMPPQAIRQQWTVDLHNLLQALAKKQPLILIFDDLQWADPTSLEVLGKLMSDPPLHRVFMLHTCRPDFETSIEALNKIPAIQLEGLAENERDELLELLTEEHGLLPEILEAVKQRAGNSPHYLLEFMKTVEQLLLEFEGSQQELAGRLSEFVPSSLREMLQSRLDRLDHRSRQVLSSASILGQQIAFELISLFDQLKDGLLEQLYTLCSLEFLIDAMVPGAIEFRFRHHLTREVVYQSILERQREEYHRQIAARLKEKFFTELESYCSIIAYHYSLSPDKEQAMEFLQMTGDQAEQQGAAEEAIDAYRSMLELLNTKEVGLNRPAQHCFALRHLGRLLRITGKAQEAIDELNKGMPVARKTKVAADAAALRTETALAMLDLGDYEGAEKELTAAQRAIAKSDNNELLGQILNARGMVAWGRGNFKQARKLFEKVDSLKIGAANPVLVGNVKNNLALLDWKSGDLKAALKQFKAAHKLHEKANDKFSTALSLMNIGIIEENLGRLKNAEQKYREAVESGERLHFRQLQGAVHGNLANLFLIQQEFDRSLVHGLQSLQIAEKIQDRRSAAIALENISLAQIGLERIDEAQFHLKQAREFAREIQDEERQFSLELVEIELILEINGSENLEEKIRQASQTLKTKQYFVEQPRLLRLQCLSKIKNGEKSEAKIIREKAIKAAEKQNNNSELQLLKAIKISA